MMVDINSVDLLILQELVGSVFASRIISLRPFYGLYDLLRVQGITPTVLENIKECVRFDHPWVIYEMKTDDGITTIQLREVK